MLKQQITELWNELTGGQMFAPFREQNKNIAMAKLEQLLIENDLLIERAERPSERAMRVSAEGDA